MSLHTNKKKKYDYKKTGRDRNRRKEKRDETPDYTHKTETNTIRNYNKKTPQGFDEAVSPLTSKTIKQHLLYLVYRLFG